jgi:hypothetical protein
MGVLVSGEPTAGGAEESGEAAAGAGESVKPAARPGVGEEESGAMSLIVLFPSEKSHGEGTAWRSFLRLRFSSEFGCVART